MGESAAPTVVRLNFTVLCKRFFHKATARTYSAARAMETGEQEVCLLLSLRGPVGLQNWR
jgi:hypothetical protein